MFSAALNDEILELAKDPRYFSSGFAGDTCIDKYSTHFVRTIFSADSVVARYVARLKGETDPAGN